MGHGEAHGMQSVYGPSSRPLGHKWVRELYRKLRVRETSVVIDDAVSARRASLDKVGKPVGPPRVAAAPIGSATDFKCESRGALFKSKAFLDLHQLLEGAINWVCPAAARGPHVVRIRVEHVLLGNRVASKLRLGHCRLVKPSDKASCEHVVVLGHGLVRLVDAQVRAIGPCFTRAHVRKAPAIAVENPCCSSFHEHGCVSLRKFIGRHF